MRDVIVSIHMPSSLISELKETVKSEHFIDLSELVRSISRQKWIESTNPSLFELKKLTEDIKYEVKKKSVEKVAQEVNKELDRIKRQLKEEGIQK